MQWRHWRRGTLQSCARILSFPVAILLPSCCHPAAILLLSPCGPSEAHPTSAQPRAPAPQLKLAWAISIHKSQGMTLPAVEIDLKSCFDDGQAYVALSRAVSLKQTRILSFDPCKVTANPRVVQYYASLAQAGVAQAAQVGAAGESQLGKSALSSSATSGASSQGSSSQCGSSLTLAQRDRLEASKAAALARRRAKEPSTAGRGQSSSTPVALASSQLLAQSSVTQP